MTRNRDRAVPISARAAFSGAIRQSINLAHCPDRLGKEFSNEQEPRNWTSQIHRVSFCEIFRT
jgi:hypothetical protein